MGKLKLIRQGLLGASALALLSAGTAYAGGTAAGTSVENTFTLSYQVAGVAQPTIDTSSSGSNNPTVFIVDRLVDLTVNSMGDKTVAPGALNQQLIFSLTNAGNDTQAYDFTLVNEAGDSFDAAGLTIKYYLNGSDPSFDPGGDDGASIAYTPGSGAASNDLDADKVIWVVVEGNIASTVVDTNTSEISLVVDTLEPSTAGANAGDEVMPDTDGNDLIGAAENVLADESGTSNEDANDGDHSDTGVYIVASANLTAKKEVEIFSEDGSGCATIPGSAGTGNQYIIPGACVEYVVEVKNLGATVTATNIAVSDDLPTELTYVTAATTGFTGGTFTQPATNADCSSVTCTVSLAGASLAAGSTGTIKIRALVQ